jgi:hypothetical protein
VSQEFCEREALVIGAARSGVWPDGLEEHVASCAVCAETRRIAQMLLGPAAMMPALPLPASVVWQRFAARRRQLALRRATRCMTLMCVLAAVYAVALAGWYLPQLWHARLVSDFSPLANGVVFAGVLAAILAVLLGSCCFAYLGSRTDFRLRS